MIYRAIGLMSGSSLDGLDMVFAILEEQGGKWTYEINKAACYPYPPEWNDRLKTATELPARDYLLLHSAYGHYLGEQVNHFIAENNLQYQVGLVASHGHTTFHLPSERMTAQLGDGAAIAAVTGLPVVTDLRAMDVALGGQGAPIVPMGEKMLLAGYDYFLNLGGIANISSAAGNENDFIAFDICPANRVLNMLAADAGQEYDKDGMLAAAGMVQESLLAQLNELEYYKQPWPKSLANTFGTDVIYPLIKKHGCTIPDALATMTEHIAVQVPAAVTALHRGPGKLLCTGGGAHNDFLVKRLHEKMALAGVEIIVPDASLVDYKEALVMAFLGILRWRQEATTLASVTGAKRSSVGGSLWNGE